jgi:hypothetical protein
MPVVDCAQVNNQPLDRLQALYGGQIVMIRRRDNCQQARAWRVHGRKAIALMMTLWTLMSERRRKQIELAREIVPGAASVGILGNMSDPKAPSKPLS